ncbi:MAG TPA: Npt1/Npt2 family nucleotide transporter [Minicystis sp.]|nr:Npt1/Npt2 family nucleotide transporter [Minicystis sp.]
MRLGAIVLRGLTPLERKKAALLFAWFFFTVATLWLLKPVRVSSLLVHLGAAETPYVRLAGVVTVYFVVMLYTWATDRLSRVGIVRWSSVLFAALLVIAWGALQIWGSALGSLRPFVWAIYILVEIYSVVMIGIFWTYANDVVTTEESNKLYGLVGVGGILGGAAGGAFVDAFARQIGPEHLLLICAGLVVVSAALGSITESATHPPARRVKPKREEGGFSAAMAGAREVKASHYLMLIVGIVVAYEFTATLTDFAISVVFEHTYRDEAMLTKMYGRLGWIVSATALVCQTVLVPLLLPKKRVALSIPPFAMMVGAIGLMVAPVVTLAMFLAAADRGLNYSVQQATKESLYVPLDDAQKYKSKAFIDMFIDRAAKALAAFALIAIILVAGESVTVSLATAMASMTIWLWSAWRLGGYWMIWNHDHGEHRPEPARAAPAAIPSEPHPAHS